MDNIFTLKGALQHGYEGHIEEWVHSFLQGVGHNPFLSYIISLEKRYFIGPVLYKLSAFSRNCGPESHMKYRVKQPGFELMVTMMLNSLKNNWDMPPLIINYEKGEFDLSDGNHRFEVLTRLGVPHYYIVFWTTSIEDYEQLKKLTAQ